MLRRASESVTNRTLVSEKQVEDMSDDTLLKDLALAAAYRHPWNSFLAQINPIQQPSSGQAKRRRTCWPNKPKESTIIPPSSLSRGPAAVQKPTATMETTSTHDGCRYGTRPPQPAQRGAAEAVRRYPKGSWATKRPTSPAEKQ